MAGSAENCGGVAALKKGSHKGIMLDVAAPQRSITLERYEGYLSKVLCCEVGSLQQAVDGVDSAQGRVLQQRGLVVMTGAVG